MKHKTDKNFQEVKSELLDLICAIDRNCMALDDDLEESWELVKEKWKEIKKTMKNYIIVGENNS